MKKLRLGVVVLAAGLSRRMGDENKLTKAFKDRPLVSHVAEMVSRLEAEDVVVVVGHQQDQVSAALSDFSHLRCVTNLEFHTGMASSLELGVSELNEEIDAFLVCLGDMPLVTKSDVTQLLDIFDAKVDPIVIPTFQGKRGNPVLWANTYRKNFENLSGDRGAKALFRKYSDRIVEVEVGGDGILKDFDDPESFKASV